MITGYRLREDFISARYAEYSEGIFSFTFQELLEANDVPTMHLKHWFDVNNVPYKEDIEELTKDRKIGIVLENLAFEINKHAKF
jgi:hypothetical protein